MQKPGQKGSGGTTSACAENTTGSTNNPATTGNYLRVRGEYGQPQPSSEALMELPPRARRIPSRGGRCEDLFGTTSACAENTPQRPIFTSPCRNYLRVRGEYSKKPGFSGKNRGTTSACAENTLPALQIHCRPGNYLRVRGEYGCSSGRRCRLPELPPRARRIHKAFKAHQDGRGTTSACAENTIACRQRDRIDRNYLRVRGEYTKSIRPTKVN